MGPRMGCLGGGQLGRMMALEGYPLGLSFTFLDPAPDSSAGQVADRLVGPYTDPHLLAELGASSDLVTFEFESVPQEAAAQLASSTEVFPGPRALAVAQDRLLEKRIFTDLGIPTAEHAPVDGPEDFDVAWSKVGHPARLKSRRLGYDGHGQSRVSSRQDMARAFSAVGGVPSILEREVAFDRELSIISVRSKTGAVAFYPLTENHHEESVLRLSLAPAPELTARLEAAAQGLSSALMEELDYCGVLAVELFQVGDRLVANEMAPRVHNSGHWTLDGAVVSQFQNHLRAGLGWPLGTTATRRPHAMVNILSSAPEREALLDVPLARVHLYGKRPRPLRKLGHVNLTGGAAAEVSAAVLATGALLNAPLPAPRYAGSYWPE